MTTFSSRGEQDAYIRGLEARSEAQRIMASPEYRAGHALDRGGVMAAAPFNGLKR